MVEGKTPDIGTAHARTLLKSIAVTDPVGLRDRAVLAVLAYTPARVGAIAPLSDVGRDQKRTAGGAVPQIELSLQSAVS